eukprot:Platyproteum_vivax@DN7374_c0_g1_i3.p1
MLCVCRLQRAPPTIVSIHTYLYTSSIFVPRLDAQRRMAYTKRIAPAAYRSYLRKSMHHHPIQPDFKRRNFQHVMHHPYHPTTSHSAGRPLQRRLQPTTAKP